MEMIWSQPGFTFCNEPLNVRDEGVARCLGIADWEVLFDRAADPFLERFFEAICAGTISINGPLPFSRYFRPLTRRIIFKEIHAGHDRINWFAERFNGRIVYLLRHPIPVSLSRDEYSTLRAFLRTDYRRHFAQDQLEFSEKVLDSGSKLERGVLAWCLQTAVALGQANRDWAIVSYEQLVLEPVAVVEYLCRKLQLADPEPMIRSLGVPSFSARKSQPATQALVESKSERSALVDRWRQEVGQEAESAAMRILDHFQLTAYRAGSALPSPTLWVGDGV